MLKLSDGNPLKLVKAGKNEHKFHVVQKVIGGDTYLVMAQSQIFLEDEFSSLYFTQSNQSNLFLMPPFNPTVLLNLVTTNNVLNQCVEAMEVNIDGTGHEFVAVEEGKAIDTIEQKMAEAFFNEPYPNQSFVKIRRKLRRELESVGIAYLEVLRNMNEDVVGLRNVETHSVRMVKLDAPILVKKKVMRDGKEVELQYWERERRFGQTVALKQQIYYREFGTTRAVNRDTGNWETTVNPVNPEDRGSELIVFGVHPDATSSYYLPRWVNQLPSVIGSRKAEEQNLEFLDSGGMPPAIIFVQGGTMVKDSADQLRMYLSGQNKNKYRAVIVEVQSSSGSLDSNQKVDVKTERFGSAQSQDAMYAKYDANTEEHVRVGFRLPPLFLGKAADYNFATASTSYMVAEAQVFQPERTDFDEMINKTIIKELGWKTLKFRSKPITLKDVATQLKGFELSKDVATRDSYIDNLNTVTSMHLTLAEMPQENVAPDQTHPITQTVDETPGTELPASIKPPSPKSPQSKPKESLPNENQQNMEKLKLEEQRLKNKQMAQPKKAQELLDLAYDYAVVKGLVQKQEVSPERELLIKQEVENLSPADKQAFNSLIATYMFGSSEPDLVSIVGYAHKH